MSRRRAHDTDWVVARRARTLDVAAETAARGALVGARYRRSSARDAGGGPGTVGRQLMEQSTAGRPQALGLPAERGAARLHAADGRGHVWLSGPDRARTRAPPAQPGAAATLSPPREIVQAFAVGDRDAADKAVSSGSTLATWMRQRRPVGHWHAQDGRLSLPGRESPRAASPVRMVLNSLFARGTPYGSRQEIPRTSIRSNAVKMAGVSGNARCSVWGEED